MTLQAALARTFLLMRDEVDASVSEEVLLAALTGTSIALISDGANVASHAAQCCFATAAMLMARSGHQVHILAPDVRLVGAQPPLGSGGIITALLAGGADMLPGVSLRTDIPDGGVDLVVALGDTPIAVPARQTIRLNADAWTARVVPHNEGARFSAQWWPVGGMGAAALAAGEAFKLAMHRLGQHFRNPTRLPSVFGTSDRATFAIAPEGTPYAQDVGLFDCVSGGAIMQAILYALARVPGVSGCGRVIEPETGDLTNLNRYMLLTRSRLGQPKASDLATTLAKTGLVIAPVNCRFDGSTIGSLGPLAPSVLVGVDDIPSRWLVQRQAPKWLGIGATTHWSAMASFHQPGLGCAQCLHPDDEPGNAPIPTVAFVSFWAGLLTATYFLRHMAQRPAVVHEQQIFMTPLRAENGLWSCVPLRAGCPTCDVAIHGSRFLPERIGLDGQGAEGAPTKIEGESPENE